MKNQGSNPINIDELKKAVSQGRVDDFIDKNLSSDASQKLRSILADKSATEKMLSTPQAKALMKKFMDK